MRTSALAELVFVKLGGSVITDKQHYQTARPEVIRRAADEIAAALRERPDLRLLLGHGSGSYGHFEAARYRVREGCGEGWLGYAATSAAAGRLNRLVTDALLAAGFPVVAVQPSASARCRDGVLESLDVEVVEALLEHGAIPLLYGDVALDAVRGCTIISTEQVFALLARRLRPQRIVMVGEVDGVFSADPHHDAGARLIPEVRACDADAVLSMLSVSDGVDVTGGMLDKVRTLLSLVSEVDGLTVQLISGTRPGLLTRTLCGQAATEGTILRA